jgi:hypothetical protein
MGSIHKLLVHMPALLILTLVSLATELNKRRFLLSAKVTPALSA